MMKWLGKGKQLLIKLDEQWHEPAKYLALMPFPGLLVKNQKTERL